MGILMAVHNTPFGDIVDTEDDMQPIVERMFHDATRTADLLSAAMASAEFDAAGLERRAGEGWITITELADALVRDHGLSFSAAHRVARRVVERGRGSGGIAGGGRGGHRRPSRRTDPLRRALQALSPGTSSRSADGGCARGSPGAGRHSRTGRDCGGRTARADLESAAADLARRSAACEQPLAAGGPRTRDNTGLYAGVIASESCCRHLSSAVFRVVIVDD
jgi:hypothetical protein